MEACASAHHWARELQKRGYRVKLITAHVGFSLAIGLLQANQPAAGFRKQAMHSVAELAMISCGGALVVLVVNTFGLSVKTTWRIGSGFTALFWGATFWWASSAMLEQDTQRLNIKESGTPH